MRAVAPGFIDTRVLACSFVSLTMSCKRKRIEADGDDDKDMQSMGDEERENRPRRSTTDYENKHLVEHSGSSSDSAIDISKSYAAGYGVPNLIDIEPVVQNTGILTNEVYCVFKDLGGSMMKVVKSPVLSDAHLLLDYDFSAAASHNWSSIEAVDMFSQCRAVVLPACSKNGIFRSFGNVFIPKYLSILDKLLSFDKPYFSWPELLKGDISDQLNTLRNELCSQKDNFSWNILAAIYHLETFGFHWNIRKTCTAEATKAFIEIHFIPILLLPFGNFTQHPGRVKGYKTKMYLDGIWSLSYDNIDVAVTIENKMDRGGGKFDAHGNEYLFCRSNVQLMQYLLALLRELQSHHNVGILITVGESAITMTVVHAFHHFTNEAKDPQYSFHVFPEITLKSQHDLLHVVHCAVHKPAMDTN